MTSRARKLLHVLPRFVGGGPERSVLALATQARAAGCLDTHTVVALDPALAPRMLLLARQAGVALVRVPDTATFTALVADADVVHLHYWNHPALTALLREVRLPPCRLIVWAHVHGAVAPQVLTEEVAGLGDMLLVTSADSLDLGAVVAATRAGVPVHHLLGMPDTQRLDGFSSRRHDGVVVGYFGLVGDGKLHPRFADLCALTTHPAIRFVVVGGGGGHDALRAELARVGLAGRAEVRGPDEDVAAVLAGFDVLGYPLDPDSYASSDRVLQEAMWVGVPPVVLPSPGIRWMVDDGVTGLVAAGEDDYPVLIDRLAADPGQRRRLGAAARAHARHAFDPAHWARRYGEVLDAVLAQPRREHPPLPGRGESAARCFVRSLGAAAGPFATSLAGVGAESGGDADAVAGADATIAAASAGLARGEGGVIHHRNAAPDDAHLRLWSGLVSEAAGRPDTAVAEYEAAAALGLQDGRAEAYARRCR